MNWKLEFPTQEKKPEKGKLNKGNLEGDFHTVYVQ